MTTNGVDIYAISIQNEPDIEVSYESCDWTSSQMRDFIKNYGHLITSAKLAAPESFNFNQAYTNEILNDDDAVANLDIVTGRYSLAESKGKEIWMTEYLLNLNEGDWANASDETKWNETMTMLNTVQTAMQNNWNAYIWWYLKRYYSFIGDGDEGTANGEILKRGYAFSHFSKFIRPGYQRIAIDDVDDTGLNLTAYQGDGKFVVVIINGSDQFVSNFDLIIDGTNISTATAYSTNLTINREEKVLTVDAEGKATLSMPARTVTTVVMQ